MSTSKLKASVVRSITPPVAVGIVALVACAATAATFMYAGRTSQPGTALVERGAIAEVVTADGTVKAEHSVDLAFQRGGTISRVSVAVGQHVVAGQTLAVLSNADLSALSQQAQANLAAQQAKLADLKAGVLPETLATQRLAVAQAIQGGYIAADDAVHNKADQFFSNPRSAQPTLNFLTSDSQLSQNVEDSRTQLEGMLTQWQNTLSSVDPTASTDLAAQAASAREDLLATQTFLDSIANALSKAIPTQSVSPATISGYQSSVASARSAVSQALSALNAAAGTLSVSQVGATPQAILAQQAAVDSARAALDLAQAQLGQSVISAPVSGIITRQDGNAGEVAAAGQSFLSLDSDSPFQIDVYISQRDLVQVRAGSAVQIALDAYPGATFDGTVISIDPAATMQGATPEYKVTAQFSRPDARIKAGLSAHLTIQAAAQSGVLLLPRSSIITRGTDQFVLKITDGNTSLAPVTVGIESDTQAQIVSGLSEGDRVEIFGTAAAQ